MNPADATIDRTFEAVVIHWDTAMSEARGDVVATVRRRIEELCAATVDVAVLSRAGLPGLDARLQAQPPGPGRLLLSVTEAGELYDVTSDGPSPLDRPGLPTGASALRRILDHFAERGVGPGLVLVIGDPSGSNATDSSLLLSLLDGQIRRRRHRRVPSIDDDAEWTIRAVGPDPAWDRTTATLFTLGAAGFATKGSVEEASDGGLVLAAGIYRGEGPAQHLVPAPAWTGLAVEPEPAADVRVLDMRTGVLMREETTDPHPFRSLRLVSADAPGVAAMRAEAAAGRLRPGPALRHAIGKPITKGRLDGQRWARVRSDTGAGIAAVASQRNGRDGPVRTVERLAAYAADTHSPPRLDAVRSVLEQAEQLGFDRLLADHRRAWARRWDAVDVRIPDDPEAQRAARFALFQLWCNVADGRAESAVGARGISGLGYAGHVFWDADAFVLPAMVGMDPRAARAMIQYRINRLPAARRAARATGHRGARFPWESAATGDDVTPTSGYLGGQVVPILTGRLEEHVTADVAWAADHYAEWTGDREFLAGRALPLLVETARYWASRCRVDAGGAAHIDAVIGPDEYHEDVDDNAYTNVMARWNLRRAADVAGDTVSPDEIASWRDLADRLVDGYDPATGRYEQFAGYHRLESLLVAEFARPPVAIDVLLGHDRVARSQLIKQPDVLMLHHLVPEETAPGSLEPNLDYYAPRTAHGSSLSPAISAALLARAGRADEALGALRTALTLDLDDATGMTASGLHLATLGGTWQALVSGFAGVRVRDGVLTVDPRLPSSWGGLELRFGCLGRRVRLCITPDEVDVETDAPLWIGLAGQRAQYVDAQTSLKPEG
ncbi:MAG TPA: glycosyl hydrolase family 65 protein [Jiangellaceae bacterium]